MLAEILAHKRDELARRRAARPLAELKARCADQEPPRDFAGALRRGDGPLKLLAEVKRGSPSRGLIDPHADPAAMAQAFARAGAAAVSVLTDERFFLGRDEHVAQIKAACALPVLRKDFTLDEYHVYEARAIGADAVLLMTQALDAAALRGLLDLARGLGLAALVEGHEPEEIERAVEAGARVIGINNRDLWTLQIDLDTTLRLLPLAPADRIVVSQSGMTKPEHVARLRGSRVDAVQIGSSIMASGRPEAAIRELMGWDDAAPNA